MLRAFAFILLLLLLSLNVLAQAQEPTPSKEKSEARGTISGRVVSESGVPIANATVWAQLANVPNSRSAQTDSRGGFQINDLEPGDYHLSSRAPAYVSPPPDRTSKRATTYRPGDSVTLTLLKGGVITGRVLNAAGQPVVWISVSAQIIGDDEGRVYPSGFRRGIETPTDDRGVYRIYGLQPGTYIVSAGGKSELSRGSMFMNAYDHDMATYAPSSYREDAAEIKVRAGEEATVDIRYRAEQGRTVSGEVRVPPNTDTRFSVTLTVAGVGATRWQTEYHPTSDTQNFVFNGVRDGDYEIFAHSYTQSGDRGGSEGKLISVKGADVEGIVLTTQPFASIAGRVVIEDPTVAECTDKERLPLHQVDVVPTHNETPAAKRIPEAIWSMGRTERPGPDGTFFLQQLAAGEYLFSTRLTGRSWYLRSVVLTPLVAPGAKAVSRPVDASRAWTNLKPGDKVSGLTLTIAHGAASLLGQLELAAGQEMPRRLIVYLVPAGRDAEDVLRFFGTPASPEGGFSFNNVPPGRYWILTQTRAEGEKLPLSQLRYPQEAATRARLRRAAEAAKNEIELRPCQYLNEFKLPLKPAGQ